MQQSELGSHNVDKYRYQFQLADSAAPLMSYTLALVLQGDCQKLLLSYFISRSYFGVDVALTRVRISLVAEFC